MSNTDNNDGRFDESEPQYDNSDYFDVDYVDTNDGAPDDADAGDYSDDYSDDYAGESDERSQNKIVSWFQGLPQHMKVGVVVGISLLVIIVLIAVSSAFSGDDDESGEAPAPSFVQSPVSPSDGSSGSPRTSEEDDDDDDPAPRATAEVPEGEVSGREEDESLPDNPFIEDDAAEGINSANNSAENDERASQISFVLDSVVNDPKTNLEGFDEMNARLKSEGVQAEASLENTYIMWDNAERSDMVIASRALKPSIVAAETPGVYKVSYKTATAMVPDVSANPQDSNLKSRLQDQMSQALNGAVYVNVDFTVDLNQNLVSVTPERWW